MRWMEFGCYNRRKKNFNHFTLLPFLKRKFTIMLTTITILILVICATFLLLLIVCLIGHVDDSKWKVSDLFRKREPITYSSLPEEEEEKQIDSEK